MMTRRRTASSRPAELMRLAIFAVSAAASAFSAAVAPAQRASSISASIGSSAAASGRGADRTSRADRSRRTISGSAAAARFEGLGDLPAGLVLLAGPGRGVGGLFPAGGAVAMLGEGGFDLAVAEGQGDRARRPSPRLQPVERPADALENDAQGDPLLFPDGDRRLVLRREDQGAAAALEKGAGDLLVVAALGAVVVHGRPRRRDQSPASRFLSWMILSPSRTRSGS